MQDRERQPEWVVKRHLSAEALKEYVARVNISRSQVIAITEHQDGVFTLIFEPTGEQQHELEAEAGQVAETLDTLFGAPVTPSVDPAAEEDEALVTIPAGPLVAPPTAPTVEPSRSCQNLSHSTPATQRASHLRRCCHLAQALDRAQPHAETRVESGGSRSALPAG